MKYYDLKSLQNQWKGKVCLFGAGLIGCTWAYDLLKAIGFRIDFYCDNGKKGGLEIRDGIKTISLETLYCLKEKVLVFITAAEKHQMSIITQLESKGINNIVRVDSMFLQTFIENLNEIDSAALNYQFNCILNDAEYLHGQFQYRVGYELNLQEPKTMNEKIQWLKINDRKPEYTQLADKYMVRQYVKENFGEEFLIPLLFKTTDWNELTYENIPNEPCIIKTNHGTGNYQIIRNKDKIDLQKLREKFKKHLVTNLYYSTREFQYKNIKPMIIIEKLLVLPNGRIPNDYKLHFFNGTCEFIYCSIDREGENYRKVYDVNWKPLNFLWSADINHMSIQQGDDIPQPKSFGQMLKIGREIAKDMRYVRVDFYDVEGKLYCGEITLHHGSGYDTFYPTDYDLYYGKKLIL